MTLTTVLLIALTLIVLAVFVVQWMFRIMMMRMLRAGAKVAIEKAWTRMHQNPNPTLKIVEADKILDEALRLLGYQGSLGEKLKKAGPRFSNINDVWRAHKLRNTLVHQLDVKPNDREVDRAISSFHKALTDLGAKI